MFDIGIEYASPTTVLFTSRCSKQTPNNMQTSISQCILGVTKTLLRSINLLDRSQITYMVINVDNGHLIYKRNPSETPVSECPKPDTYIT